MKFHFSKSSSNAKTGKMPVTTSPEQTCPPTCPWKKSGCYAKYGPISWHWKKVSREERGVSWEEFLTEIKKLPEGTLWRHNQAGDLLPGSEGVISHPRLEQLIEANSGKKGFTYTHYTVLHPSGNWDKQRIPDLYAPLVAISNRVAISMSNSRGFTINLSANSLEEADQMVDLGIAPVTTVVDSNEKRPSFKSPGGNRVTLCPAIARDDMSCARCKLCANSKRKTIIAFPAHGSSKKSIDNSLSKV